MAYNSNRYIYPEEYYLHQRQRQYDYYNPQYNSRPQYYQSLPKKRISGSQRHNLHRSLSTGNMRRKYTQDMQQSYIYDEQQGHDWYYKDTTHAPNRRQYQEEEEDQDIPEDLHKYYLEVDGEPLNELELLALKNAAINKRKSKIAYTEEEEQEVLNKLKEEDETTVEQVEDISDQMSDLTLTQSTPEEPAAVKEQEPPVQKTSKKRWPLSFLFKKGAQVAVNEKSPSSTQLNPTKSTSTPPTPILSPNNESIISSSTSSSTLVPNMFWAFRFPSPTNPVWCRFDIENQRKLFSHMNQTFMLEILDSHLPGIPIIVIPSQKIAYYLTNINQINYLELALF